MKKRDKKPLYTSSQLTKGYVSFLFFSLWFRGQKKVGNRWSKSLHYFRLVSLLGVVSYTSGADWPELLRRKTKIFGSNDFAKTTNPTIRQRQTSNWQKVSWTESKLTLFNCTYLQCVSWIWASLTWLKFIFPRLELIFTTAPAASKNDAHLKSGQNWLKDSHLNSLI